MTELQFHVSRAIAAHWLVCAATPLFLRAAGREEEALRLFQLEGIAAADLARPRPGIIASTLQPVAAELDAERRELLGRLAAERLGPTVYRYGSPLDFRKKVMPGLTELGNFARWSFERSRLGWHAYYVMGASIDVEQLRADLAFPVVRRPSPTLLDAYERAMGAARDLVRLDALESEIDRPGR